MQNRFLFFILLHYFCGFSQQKILIFANGYLGPCYDKIERNNQISSSPHTLLGHDSHGYWYAYDDMIINRFKPVTSLYISGHHSLRTSPHRGKFTFACSYLITRFFLFRSKKGLGLNRKPNPEGFMTRFNNGKICGQNFLQYAKDSIHSDRTKDTLHIVCHSMGYSYILGFLTQVDSIYNLGKILIIAPESPSLLGYDWNRFQEVWQYGSNLGTTKPDWVCFQDGIAPQAPIRHLETLEKQKGGRVFTPKNAKRGFIRSHHLKYFEWFESIKPGDYGYFAP
jgi:hypothetical protein